MSFPKKALISCAQITLIVAAVYYGGTYLTLQYIKRFVVQNVTPDDPPGAAVPGRRATDAEKLAAQKAVTPAEARKEEAKQHYLAGIRFLQDARYERALEEFKKGKKLDPANKDIQAGVERVKKILAH
jgi:hypothetical protein